MDDLVGGIRPETHALDALIEATLKRREGDNRQSNTDSMLFLGDRHAPFPAWVVQDPVLEPVDKLVWMAIVLKAQEAGSTTTFPTYDTIAKTANVSSTATIARALAILRITRWLTLCGRIPECNGRFRGHVFALHNEPLPLVDALHLDTGYMTFLHESLEHRHARVCTVARDVLDSLNEAIDAGLDVCTDGPGVGRKTVITDSVEQEKPRHAFAYSAKVMAELRSQNDNHENSRVQNLHPQNLKGGSCSSSNLNKTTTTQTTERKNFIRAEGHHAPLIYPERLGDDHRELADRYLASVSADLRQPILDELEGRFRSEKKGMPPLYDEMSFLFSLCKAMKNGEFKANLGIRVEEERRARQKAHRKRVQRSAPVPSVNARDLCDRMAACEGPIAAMRKSLGISHRHTRERDTDESS
jgi:hypothetical protein